MTPWDCLDCGQDAWRFVEDGRFVHEDFYVSNHLWLSVVPDNDEDSLLCIGCFEARLGRKLRRADLRSGPHDLFGDPPSARFRDRWSVVP